MLENDFGEFAELLDGTSHLLSRGKYVPNERNTALFFRALGRHPMEVVRAAFEAHIADPQRGQYVPNPADILAQIEGRAAVDGRPGAEEAWALASRASDQTETIVWTQEMAQAWEVSRSVMEMGDEVGARMAFKESYNRHVDDARRLRVPVAWSTSIGHDPAKRSIALARAQTMGLIGGDEVARLSGPGEASVSLQFLLESSVKRNSQSIDDPEEIKRRAAELRERLVKKGPDPEIAVHQQAAIQRQKACIAAQVAAYQSKEAQA